VYSAQAAFFIIVSFFPFMMVLLSIIRLIPPLTNTIHTFSVEILNDTVSSLVNGLFAEVIERSTGAVLSLSTVMGIWSASRGLLALKNGMNGIYGIKKRGSFLRMRAVSFIYTIALAGVLILTLILLVFGDLIVRETDKYFPGFISQAIVFLRLRWVVQYLLLMMFFVFIYTVVPDVRTKAHHQIPGAAVAAAGWAGFSFGYSLYLKQFPAGPVYGSITAIVLLMLWLYFCMYILFFGAVLNDVLYESTSPKPEVISYKRHKRKE
jgi:membrane protein